ncbi:MAG: hypothetical protein KAS02_01925 [Candidatus Pacebacteria bacterium]|nr:hypothetical protein [Candidatus Paceibacterota bacterium]
MDNDYNNYVLRGLILIILRSLRGSTITFDNLVLWVEKDCFRRCGNRFNQVNTKQQLISLFFNNFVFLERELETSGFQSRVGITDAGLIALDKNSRLV